MKYVPKQVGMSVQEEVSSPAFAEQNATPDPLYPSWQVIAWLSPLVLPEITEEESLFATMPKSEQVAAKKYIKRAWAHFKPVAEAGNTYEDLHFKNVAKQTTRDSQSP